MEEILASIRRIISEDDEEGGGESEAQADEGAAAAEEDAAAAEPEPDPEPDPEPEQPVADDDADDVLELTDVVGDDGNVVSLADAMPEPEPDRPVFPAAPAPDLAALDNEPLEPVAPNDPLLSEQPQAQAAGSIAELMAGLSSDVLLGDRDKTLEELVKDLVRPMLKRWLDDNLPNMVEQIVREELERVIARGRGR